MSNSNACVPEWTVDENVVDESSSCLFWMRVSACATRGGFSLMSCIPQHLGTDNDDVCLVTVSRGCSSAVEKLSFTGGFLSNKFDDVEEDDEGSPHTGRCNCLPLLGGGFGDA